VTCAEQIWRRFAACAYPPFLKRYAHTQAPSSGRLLPVIGKQRLTASAPCPTKLWSVFGGCATGNGRCSDERGEERRGENADPLAGKMCRQGVYGILRGSEPECFRVGAGDGIRTRDPLLGKQLAVPAAAKCRSRLPPSPNSCRFASPRALFFRHRERVAINLRHSILWRSKNRQGAVTMRSRHC
jgi:hypothetical protein